MEEQRQKYIIYGIVSFFTLSSFLVSYSLFSRDSNERTPMVVREDTLSGEEYTTAGIYNYRENNPYGSYFVGLENLTDAGVTNQDMVYIEDILTNFTMYNLKIYNGRISYVKDSFRDTGSNDSLYRNYEFSFGVNNANIHTVKIKSSWLKEVLHATITDKSNNVQLDKEFKVYP